MHRVAKDLLVSFALVIVSTLSLAAQSASTRQIIATRGKITGPLTLDVDMTSYGARLRWPPVANAIGYNVTRVANAGTPETLIASRTTAEYASSDNHCATGSSLPHCVYLDNQFSTVATNLTLTYRVYAIVPGHKGRILSPPSPSASVIWRCPNCPKLP